MEVELKYEAIGTPRFDVLGFRAHDEFCVHKGIACCGMLRATVI